MLLKIEDGIKSYDVPKQIPYIKKNSFLKIPFFILEDNNEVIKQILVPNVRKLFKEI